MRDRDKSLLTITEAADLLGIHFQTLRNWSDAGMVPAVMTPKGHRRYERSALEQFQHDRGYGTVLGSLQSARDDGGVRGAGGDAGDHAALMDRQRVQAMADVATAILDRADLGASNHVVSEVTNDRVTVALFRGQHDAQWQIEAVAPLRRAWMTTTAPARLTWSGVSITPLCLEILRAWSALMWEEQER